MACNIDARSLKFLKPLLDLDYFVLEEQEVKKLEEVVRGCGDGKKIRTVSVEAIIAVMNSIFESKDPRRAYEAWLSFFASSRASPHDVIEAVSVFRETGGISASRSMEGGQEMSSLWRLFSGLVPEAPRSTRAACSLIWKTALYIGDAYKRHKFEIGLAQLVIASVFPAVQSGYLWNMIGSAQGVLDVMTTKNVKGIATLLKNMRKNQPDVIPRDDKAGFQSAMNDLKPFFFRKKSGGATLASDSDATHGAPIQKKVLASKNSGVLTKGVNYGVRTINDKIEEFILMNPFLAENGRFVPIALSLLYSVKKSIVIDKYESLVRSVNNYTRRALGQKIRPVKQSPLKILGSGRVRPIIRRDLLASNLLILLATMSKEIAECVKEWINE